MISTPDSSENVSRGSRPASTPRASSQHAVNHPSLTPSEDRRWATLAHFGAVAGCVPSLIIWLTFRDRGPFTAQESKEALNFTLPLTITMVVFFILGFIPGIDWVASLGAVLLWILMAVGGLIGGIECNKGRPYRYGLNLRLIN